MSAANVPATVYLVGAGPGDPGMLTLRGAEVLGRAQVVLYDYLANPALLRHVRPEAELVCLGRHGQGRMWSQEEIHQRLLLEARAGKTVVRLKGGDPAVFARGAQEAEFLAEHGVPFEIVPGITTALAAGSCAGIPITHHDLASAVALVTGQERPGKEESQLDYAALAAFPGTLVFYMGVTTARRWTADLLAAGKPPETPAAVIRRASLPDQQTFRCRLDEVAEVIDPPNGKRMRPPVIVVVGEVAGVDERLAWFERRPLFGRTVLVARPAGQAEELAGPLAERGARVLVQPAIEIGPPEDWAPVDRALTKIGSFDWLVFSSGNGVRALLGRLLEQGGDLRALGGVKLAAIGPGTAAALAAFHLKADVIPAEYRAEALVEALASSASGKRFLLARASRGREVLREGLVAAGAEVEQVVVYASRDCAEPDAEIAELLRAGEVDCTAVTSSAIARSLAALFGAALRQTKLVSISPITSETLRACGFEPAAEAKTYTMEGVTQAVEELLRRE